MPKNVTLSWKEYEKLTAIPKVTDYELSEAWDNAASLTAQLETAERLHAALKATYEHTLGQYRAQKAELLEVCGQRDEANLELTRARAALAEVESQDIDLLATQNALQGLWTITDEALRRTRPAGSFNLVEPAVLVARERKALTEPDELWHDCYPPL
jgi:hypothetical protein